MNISTQESTKDALQRSFRDNTSIMSLCQSVLPESEHNRQIRALEAELIKKNALIKKLEADLDTDEPRRKRLLLGFDSDLKRLKTASERDRERSDNLELEALRLREKCASLTEQLAASKGEFDAQKDKYRNDVKNLEERNFDLQTEVDELRSRCMESTRSTQNEIRTLRDELSLCRTQWSNERENVALLRRQLEEKQCALRTALDDVIHWQERAQRCEEVERQLSSSDETHKRAQLLSADLRRLPRLEEETKKLRHQLNVYKEIGHNNTLLEAELRTCRDRVSRLEEAEEGRIRAETETQRISGLLDRWLELAKRGAEFSSPSNILHYVNQLKQSEANLIDQSSKLSAENHALQAKMESTTAQLNAVLSAKEEEARQNEELNSVLKRLKRRFKLVIKERDAHRSVLDSYENEMTINPNSMQTRRISALESTLADYKNVIDEQEKELSTVRLHGNATNVARVAIGVQTDCTEGAEEEATSNFRVLHFSVNPLENAHQRRMSELLAAEEENVKLRARVRLLEERGKEADADITQEVEQLVRQNDDPKVLKERLIQVETKMKRYMEAFRKTSKEFRQVCYVLTGYRIDVESQHKYKARHVYAESPDDYLLFETTTDGAMNMLETPYSVRLSDLIVTYLKNFDSIPAFLASLTMQLFNQQTMMMKSHDSSAT